MFGRKLLNVVRKQCGTLNAAVRNSSSYGDVPMPPCDFVPEPYTSMSREEALQYRKKNLNPGYVKYYRDPVMVHQGHMQWLFDVDGRRYLDFFGGIVTVSVGHCHPKLNAAIEKQIKKLWHTTSIYVNPTKQEYARKLVAKLPKDLDVVTFVNSGTEANDLAIAISRMYTGAWDVISLRNGYHGVGVQTSGMTQLGTWRMPMPHGFGHVGTMNADPYRGPWGGSRCRDSPCQTLRSCDCAEGSCHAKDMYVDQYRDTLTYSVPPKIAAFFAEGIQGVGGTVQFPKGFLKEVCDLTHERGGLFVMDEVQTGFGRLGSHFWGFESHGLTPDIVTMAKGIGNGFPMAAVVTRHEIANTLSRGLWFNTFGGNPLACTVGSATLDVIEEENLQKNCEEVGTYLLNGLAKLRDRFEIVGDVRGKGLMIGVEMVEDKLSRTPIAPEKMADIWEDTKDLGILLGKGGLYGNVFRLKPPMCITKKDAEFAIDVMGKAIQNLMNKQ